MILALAAALTLSATLSPSSHAPALVPITISLSVTNRTRAPITLEFPSPDHYFVEVLDSNGKVLFDSRTKHKPIPVHSKMDFGIGRTQVASYVWNGLTDEQHTLVAPGKYNIHVEMPSVATPLSVDLPFMLEAPQTIASVLAATRPAQATISGTPEREDSITYLRDDTGRIALTVPLGMRPQGGFLVRGTMHTVINRVEFVTERFAPAADNSEPEGTPIPRATPIPTPTSSRRSR
ncbi:MAG: hypothetical protein JO241_05865 [Candidatus Eremiobacteraeota bacterium]|nr:hypothetical protein [Candidatus Eremiobacteraeota bacterium]